MRDLTRARGAAVEDVRQKGQQVSAFLLRLGRHYAGRTWTKAHLGWLASQKFEHPEQRIAFEELLLAVHQAKERVGRLEEAIRLAVPDWSLAEVVVALMAMRGIDMVTATAFLAEIGDLSRFRTPRQLMAYLGLVPSEQSTGDTVVRGPITKAGNRRARRLLIESAWAYRHPPRVGKDKQAKVAAASPPSSGLSLAKSPTPIARQLRRAFEDKRTRHRRTPQLPGEPLAGGRNPAIDRHRARAGAKPRQGEFP
jgi:transposase